MRKNTPISFEQMYTLFIIEMNSTNTHYLKQIILFDIDHLLFYYQIMGQKITLIFINNPNIHIFVKSNIELNTTFCCQDKYCLVQPSSWWQTVFTTLNIGPRAFMAEMFIYLNIHCTLKYPWCVHFAQNGNLIKYLGKLTKY